MVARSSGGRAAQVIVYGRRLVDVDTMPKTYAPGAPITIKARPTDAFGEFVLLADDENEAVAEEGFAAGEGGAFTITRPAPKRPGRYFLEIRGLDARTLHMPVPGLALRQGSGLANDLRSQINTRLRPWLLLQQVAQCVVWWGHVASSRIFPNQLRSLLRARTNRPSRRQPIGFGRAARASRRHPSNP